MKRCLLALAIISTPLPALAKEAHFIEMAAVFGVARDVCGSSVSDNELSTLVGAAMIEQALPKATVIARATKRGSHIRNHVLKSRTQDTFCEALRYYLDHGYPK